MTDYMELAEEAAGNWRRFNSFAWFGKPEDGDNWTIMNPEHRDSTIREKSNAAAFRRELEKWTEGDDPDVTFERHSHWAVGWMEALCVRVYGAGATLTAAFTRLCELNELCEDDGYIDEIDYYNRVHDEQLDTIKWLGKPTDDAPEDWPSAVYYWLRENDDRALCDETDQGYVSESGVKTALRALGWFAWDDESLLRAVRVEGYELYLYDTGEYLPRGHHRLTYVFKAPDGEVIFPNGYIGIPIGNPIDSDEVVRSALGSVTMRPGDTDDEYFEDYTPRQMEFVEADAEELSIWSLDYAEGEEPPPFEEIE